MKSSPNQKESMKGLENSYYGYSIELAACSGMAQRD